MHGPYGLGHKAEPAAIAPIDIDVAPDGAGLPDGTLFDYVRRAMPPDRIRPLRANELYAISAHELYVNGVIGRDAIVDRNSLPRIQMPDFRSFVEVPSEMLKIKRLRM